MLVHLISAAILTAGVIYHLKTVNKLKETIIEKESIIKALQLHSEIVSKKKEQLLKELKDLRYTAKPSEISINTNSAPAKNKKVFKAKPKAKVEA